MTLVKKLTKLMFAGLSDLQVTFIACLDVRAALLILIFFTLSFLFLCWVESALCMNTLFFHIADVWSMHDCVNSVMRKSRYPDPIKAMDTGS